MDFLYDESGTPYSLVYDGVQYYYVKNVQGDVVQIRGLYGTLRVEYTYDVWGNVISITGSSASGLGANNPIRYRSYYYDFETGFYYLNSRYYDPAMRRFINADGYVSTGQGFIGYNMYVYCNNNPVNYVDYTGCDPIPQWVQRIVNGNALELDYITALNINPEAWCGYARIIIDKAIGIAEEHTYDDTMLLYSEHP